MTTKLKTTSPLLLLSLLFLLSGCFFNSVKGSGEIKRDKRNLSEFDQIEISGAFDVYLKQGEPYIELVADDNLLPLIKTVVKNGELQVYSDENLNNSTKLELYISYPSLEELDISGAVEVKSKSVIKNSTFEIDASGATEVELEVDVNELELDLSGASEVRLSGKTKKLEIDGSGAIEVDAYNLAADDVKIEISGAGDAKVTANKSLKVRVSGAGSVRYKGKPESVNQETSGAGSVKSVSSN